MEFKERNQVIKAVIEHCHRADLPTTPAHIVAALGEMGYLVTQDLTEDTESLVSQLQADLDRVAQMANSQRVDIIRLIEQRNKLRAHLTSGLKYGVHTASCAIWKVIQETKCSCGYTEWLDKAHILLTPAAYMRPEAPEEESDEQDL